MLCNSGIPFVEIYLKIIMIEEPNDYYAKIFIGALLEKQKCWKRPKNPTEPWLEKMMAHSDAGIYSANCPCEAEGKGRCLLAEAGP